MRKFDILTTKSLTGLTLQADSISWNDFLSLMNPIELTLDLNDFNALPPEKQRKVKDKGAFIAGSLVDMEQGRKKDNINKRSMLVLDLDKCSMNALAEVDKGLSAYTYYLHTTFSSRVDKPRYHLIIPFEEDVTPEQYSQMAIKVMSLTNISNYDITCVQANRLMLFPVVLRQTLHHYFHKENKGKLLSYNDLVGVSGKIEFTDTTNVFPTKKKLEKLTDPANKKGLIGDFCSKYSISEAIDTYLSDIWIKEGDRYRYFTSSSIPGGIVYENDKYFYSNHNNDPHNSKLLNSYDLVRLHLFGDLDIYSSPKCRTSNLPSTAAMNKLIMDENLIEQAEEETVAELPNNLGSELNNNLISDNMKTNTNTDKTESFKDFLGSLERGADGKVKPNFANIEAIFNYEFPDSFYTDKRTSKKLIKKEAANKWSNTTFDRSITSGDYSAVCNYIIGKYKTDFFPESRVRSFIETQFVKNQIDSFAEKLKGLQWDGKKRAETVFMDCLGVEDTELNRAISYKQLFAMVARQLHDRPIKWDNVLILKGEQGIGKTTLLEKIALGVENHIGGVSLAELQSKETLQRTSGKIIIEFAELMGLKKSSIEDLKQYLSSVMDTYRLPYEKEVIEKVRKSICFGTTNQQEILKDITGNRRFLILECSKERIRFYNWDQPNEYWEQIWAELIHDVKEKENDLKSVLIFTEAQMAEIEKGQRNYIDFDKEQEAFDHWILKIKMDRVCPQTVEAGFFNNSGADLNLIKRLMARCPYLTKRDKVTKVNGYTSRFAYEINSEGLAERQAVLPSEDTTLNITCDFLENSFFNSTTINSEDEEIK